MAINKCNLVDYIMSWEDGSLSQKKELELFSYIIKTKLYLSLQGMYGRHAKRLIDAGYLSKTGKILIKP